MVKSDIDRLSALIFQMLEKKTPQAKLDLLRKQFEYIRGVKAQSEDSTVDLLCEVIGHCVDALLEEHPELRDSSEGKEREGE